MSSIFPRHKDQICHPEVYASLGQRRCHLSAMVGLVIEEMHDSLSEVHIPLGIAQQTDIVQPFGRRA